MRFTTVFFDLDDTLYPSSAGLWFAIRERMSRYMVERMCLPLEQVDNLRRHYLETYGTTLRGLQHEFHIDSDDYLAYVHDLPLAEYIQPVPKVREMLLSLPKQRWIFTNSDINHVRRVLTTLDLDTCFHGIIDVRALDFLNKPDPLAYKCALKIAGEPISQRCVLLDDSLHNLVPARQMGFTTVLVNPDQQNGNTDYQISKIEDLPNALPELWKP